MTRTNGPQKEKKQKLWRGATLVGVVVLSTALVLFGRCPGKVEPIQKECPPCICNVEPKKPVKKPVKPEKKPEKPGKKVAIVKKPPEKRTLGPCPSGMVEDLQGAVETQVTACTGPIRKKMPEVSGDYSGEPILVTLNSVLNTSGRMNPAQDPGFAVPVYDGEKSKEKLSLEEVMSCLKKRVRAIRTTTTIEEPGCKASHIILIPQEE